jgi:uncharacterized membrane protein
MTLLIVGLLAFLGVHSVRIAADDWRSSQIARHGLKTWKGVYSLIALVGLVLIVWGYDMARQSPLIIYSPPAGLRQLGSLLTVPAFILLAAAYVPRTRIKHAVGHPMILGVKLWAFAHLLANGALADLVLFGSFLVWAVFDFSAARRRDRAASTVYQAGPLSRDAVAILVGLGVWAVFAFWLHDALIGVRPFGA